MHIVELILIAVGLAMDAFAVAVCKGLSSGRLLPRHYLLIGLWFGGAQALMPTVGYLLGAAFADYIEAFDHWIAFVLLALIGFNMLHEGLEKNREVAAPPCGCEAARAEAATQSGAEAETAAQSAAPCGCGTTRAGATQTETAQAETAQAEAAQAEAADFSVRTMLLLALATSIDALAAGISFALLPGVSIGLCAALIGGITFGLSALGLWIGRRFGLRFKARAEIAGGCILVLMGLKILLEHLGVLPF